VFHRCPLFGGNLTPLAGACDRVRTYNGAPAHTDAAGTELGTSTPTVRFLASQPASAVAHHL
jgi:hypothetical protein